MNRRNFIKVFLGGIGAFILSATNKPKQPEFETTMITDLGLADDFEEQFVKEYLKAMGEWSDKQFINGWGEDIQPLGTLRGTPPKFIRTEWPRDNWDNDDNIVDARAWIESGLT